MPSNDERLKLLSGLAMFREDGERPVTDPRARENIDAVREMERDAESGPESDGQASGPEEPAPLSVRPTASDDGADSASDGPRETAAAALAGWFAEGHKGQPTDGPLDLAMEGVPVTIVSATGERHEAVTTSVTLSSPRRDMSTHARTMGDGSPPERVEVEAAGLKSRCEECEDDRKTLFALLAAGLPLVDKLAELGNDAAKLWVDEVAPLLR